jgi:two-component system, chemotaxis family, response regulator Rcp1
MRIVEGNDPPVEVLLVEDSPGDVRLTQEAFRHTNRSVQLHVAADGVEAMAFLTRAEGQAHAPRPDLILLDLNIPRMDGRGMPIEVLLGRSVRRYGRKGP